jgi:hypothetical protein
MVNLSRPCDACGKMIGGGFHLLPKMPDLLLLLLLMPTIQVFKINQSTNAQCAEENLSKANSKRKADFSSILAKNLLLCGKRFLVGLRIFEDISKVR